MNITPIFRGDNTPQLQWQEREFDPVRGYIYYYDLHGLSQAQMILLQNQFTSQGIESKIRLEKDTATLSAVDSTQTYTIDSWQVASNDESFDGLTNPNLLAATMPNDANGHVVSAMREHLNAQDDLAVFQADPIYAAWLTAGATGAQQAIVTAYYLLQQRGSTEYRGQGYVLRHSTNAPANWAGNGPKINVADIGVGAIYTPAQCLSEVTNSAAWIFPLPQRLVNKLGFIPAQAPGANDPCSYLWGWLKSPSTEQTVANNRVEIITEYTLALWSLAPNGYYPAFTAGTGPSSTLPVFLQG